MVWYDGTVIGYVLNASHPSHHTMTVTVTSFGEHVRMFLLLFHKKQMSSVAVFESSRSACIGNKSCPFDILGMFWPSLMECLCFVRCILSTRYVSGGTFPNLQNQPQNNVNPFFFRQWHLFSICSPVWKGKKKKLVTTLTISIETYVSPVSWCCRLYWWVTSIDSRAKPN